MCLLSGLPDLVESVDKLLMNTSDHTSHALAQKLVGDIRDKVKAIHHKMTGMAPATPKIYGMLLI